MNPRQQIILKPGTYLREAYLDRPYADKDFRPLATEQDTCGDALWVGGNEFGATVVIQADSLTSAWEIMVDAMTPIEEGEVHEAYGYECQQCFDRDVFNGATPELIEGYEHQPNATGTGIVDVGHYTRLEELTPGCMKAQDIRIVVGKD